MTFFGASLALESALELLVGPAIELVITSCHTHSLHITIQSRNGSLLWGIRGRWHFKRMIFLICGQLMKHPLIELFHLSNLLQMPHGCRMVDVEFFSIFSYSWERIGFDDPLSWLLSTSDDQPLCTSSSRLSSLCRLLHPPPHCTVVSSSWIKFVVDVVSCLYCSMTHFELVLKKIAWICFLSNIISIV